MRRAAGPVAQGRVSLVRQEPGTPRCPPVRVQDSHHDLHTLAALGSEEPGHSYLCLAASGEEAPHSPTTTPWKMLPERQTLVPEESLGSCSLRIEWSPETDPQVYGNLMCDRATLQISGEGGTDLSEPRA